MSRLLKILVAVAFILSTKAYAVNDMVKQSLVGVGIGIAANIAIEKELIPQCSATNAAACAMVAMAAGQVIAYAAFASDAHNTDERSNCEGTQCYGGTTGTTLSDDGQNLGEIMGEMGFNLDLELRDARRIQKDLEGKGYKYNDDGSITTPKGKLSSSAFSSASAMKEAGFSDEEVNMAKNMHTKVKKEVEKRYASLSGSHEGGPAKGSALSNDFSFDAFKFKLPTTKVEEKPTVVGLSKSHGKDQIGVASDDIFGMVARRYTDQRKKGLFIESQPVKREGSSLNSAE